MANEHEILKDNNYPHKIETRVDTVSVSKCIDGEKQNENDSKLLEEQIAIFRTLSRNFKNLYLVNIYNETARVLKYDDEYPYGEIEVFGGNDFPYVDFLNDWINVQVHPDDRETLRRDLSPSRLREIFMTEDEYVGNYRMLIDGRIINYQFNLSKADIDGYIIAGFQNIDGIIQEHLKKEKAEKEKEAAHKKEIDEQLAIIDTLSRSFRNVFVANMKDGTARAIRLADSYRVKAIRDVEKTVFPFDAVVNRWIRETVHPDDKEKIKEILDLKYIKKALSEQDEIVGNYRNIEDGVQHHYQFDIRQIGNTENVVAGFQIIDSIIEEQEAKQKREQELEQAHLRDEREHTEIINSLSTIYSTIIKVEIDTKHYEVFASVSLMDEVAGKHGNFEEKKEEILSAFLNSETRERMEAFLDFDTLAERLRDLNTVATEYKAPDGRWKQVRFIVKRRDEAGIAREALFVARDITVEKNNELKQQEALTQALAAAQQANKAKTTFLNSMSHDIRTPMNAIIGFTALAQTHIKDEKQVQDYLSKISTSGAHLLSLINDILDMSRIESGTVKLDEKAVHIPDLLRDLQIMIQGLVNSKNLNLFVDTQDVVHEDVLTDKLRLNQVLLNIVSNAVKFTQPGGDIIIRLVEKPCSLKHHTTYEFSVKDNGIGMSKEFQGHIFETFTREYSSTVSGIQGTGLGMAITKNIVDMMGGDIRVESEVGKGSLFTVTLNLRLAGEPVKSEPISELPGSGDAGAAAFVSNPAFTSEIREVLTHPVESEKITQEKEKKKVYDYSDKHILLVEDNELNREIATAILEETGMIIDSVEDGDVAVATINSEPADKYDLIIMDIQMPRMDGYTATREIRTLADNKKANIPIVAMTANAFEEDRKKAFESGMNGHIIKPISIEAIAEVLDEIFAEKK